MLVDDNGVSCFVDDLGITCWVDDLGQTLCCGATTGTDVVKTSKSTSGMVFKKGRR